MIGKPLVAHCQPVDDDLPEPMACLITGITPQSALEKGVPEPEFAALIHDQMAVPATCTVGYNSIRFDDEVTRHLFYRNFFDPYAREWQNGNSRWDLIDVVRLCYALRPDGITWPKRDDGAPSFRLEDLAQANELQHDSAHDALSDVLATIALARLLRSAQPRLFDYCSTLRDKNKVRGLLNFTSRTPVLHASGKYRSEAGGVAMVLPLCPHPVNRNGVIVYNLMESPHELLALNAEEIADRIFTPNADLPEGTARIALKTVHLNRAPVLCPVNTLKGVDTERIQLDPKICEQHRQEILNGDHNLVEKIQTVFGRGFIAPDDLDVEQSLYSGLIGNADLALFPQVRAAPDDQLSSITAQLHDPRLQELAFRYRARFHPDTLSLNEAERWQQQRTTKLTKSIDGIPRLQAYSDHLLTLRETTTEPNLLDILDQLERWAIELEATV